MKKWALLLIGLTLVFANVAWASVCPTPKLIGKLNASANFKPTRGATGPDGVLYVTDMAGDKVRIYAADGSLLKSLRIVHPLGVHLDASGKVYIGRAEDVAGLYKGEVKVYDANFNELYTLGIGWGEFQYPVAVNSDADYIYVADNRADLIKVYNLADGTFSHEFGGYGSDDSSIPRPSGIAIHPETGNLYISDYALQYDADNIAWGLGAGVHIYNSAGTFISKFPITFGYSGAANEMASASGIVIDSKKRVLVTDSSMGNMQVFDDTGTNICSIKLSDSTLYPTGPSIGDNGILYVPTVSGTLMYSTDEYTKLSVSATDLTFTSQDCAPAPAQQSVGLSNEGNGTMPWTASADASWITLSSGTGTIVGMQSETLTISVDKDDVSLSSGENKGVITLSSENEITTLNITLNIADAPVLDVTAGTYDFTVNGINIPASIALPVNLTGDITGDMQWTATVDSSWISASPTFGPSDTAALASVGISAAGLGEIIGGDYSGKVVVSASCASIPDVEVPVNLTYINGGTIEVNANINEADYSLSGPQSLSGTGTYSKFDSVSEGTYTITFTDITGVLEPASYSLSVANGQTVVFSANYTDLREDNNIIVTMGTAAKGINDELVVFDEAGSSVGSIMVNLSRGRTALGGSVSAAGDIDGDGDDEVVVANSDGVVMAFESDGTRVSGLYFMAFPRKGEVDLEVADFDGDGKEEIVVGSKDKAVVRVLSYSGTTVIDTGINFLAYQDNNANKDNNGVYVATGDVDNDGLNEIITTEAGTGSRFVDVMIWNIDTSVMGAWSVTSGGSFEAGASFTSADVTVGDLDADGNDEIIIIKKDAKKSNTSLITAYEADGTVVFEVPGPSADGGSIASGDLDNDGTSEIVVSEGQGDKSSTSIHIYNSDGTYRVGFDSFNNPDIHGAIVSVGQVAGQ